MATNTIPFTAWEQAVFVALFIIFCLGLIGALLNWFSRQQASWQKFMAEQNKEWRDWLDRSEKRSCDHLDALTGAIEKIAVKLEEHDNRVDERIKAAAATAVARAEEPKTQPRRRT